MAIKPILFNKNDVRAILDGRKTVTRRVAFKGNDLRKFCSGKYPEGWWFRGRVYSTWDNAMKSPQGVMSECKYHPGDIMYVRETWCKGESGYSYRADYDMTGDAPYIFKWHPSIHMPKEAARIWLRVTNVRVERLQDCGCCEAKEEGCTCGSQFARLWDSTVKKSDLDRYSWEANPWVWVVEFERCKKPESEAKDRCAKSGLDTPKI